MTPDNPDGRLYLVELGLELLHQLPQTGDLFTEGANFLLKLSDPLVLGRDREACEFRRRDALISGRLRRTTEEMGVARLLFSRLPLQPHHQRRGARQQFVQNLFDSDDIGK